MVKDMNRNGNIASSLLLVLAALALIGYSLYAMLTFNPEIDRNRAELRDFSDKSTATHEIILNNLKNIIYDSIKNSTNSNSFEVSFTGSLKELSLPFRNSGLNTNAYAKLSSIEGIVLNSEGTGYELDLKDIFENYNVYNNELRYVYSIKVIFDREKIISFSAI